MRRTPIEGSTVLITGASSGLGAAVAEALARHRCRLVLAARTASALDAVAERCRDLGAGDVLTVPTDVGIAQQVRDLRAAAVARFDTVDTWIDAAAVLVAGSLGDQADDEIEAIVRTNVLGPMWCSREAIDLFRQQGHGSLINVSSLLSMVPNPLVPSYVATKFAVRGLGLSLRLAVRKERGIDVSTVLPGPIDTPMFERAANRTGRELRAIPPAYSVDRVAAGVLACMRRPRRQKTVGAVGHALMLASRVAPATTDRIAGPAAAWLLVRDQVDPTVAGPPADGRAHGGYRLDAVRSAIGDRVGRWQSARVRAIRR
ncbi:MAG: SDR family NAD(P)-dependent oxidoreductase [Aquihabitans sp.]